MKEPDYTLRTLPQVEASIRRLTIPDESAQAQEDLAHEVAQRLCFLASSLDHRDGEEALVLEGFQHREMTAQIESSLFSHTPLIDSVQEFYSRAAPLIVTWLCERLQVMTEGARTRKGRKRFNAWLEMHQLYWTLMDDKLIEVVNVRPLGGRTLAETAKTLNLKPAEVEQAMIEYCNLVRPQVEIAR